VPRIAATALTNGLYVPLLTVEIDLGHGVLSGAVALIDSGADLTVFPAEAMAAAGITWASLKDNSEKSKGAGGGFETSVVNGAVAWGGTTICEEFRVSEPGALPWGLLGREDFFKLFVVRFHWHKDPPQMDIDPVVGLGKKKPKRR
jgi:hypothetical protein